MKDQLKKLFATLCIVCVVAVCGACESDGSSDDQNAFRFKNESSVAVTISPGPGEKFGAFVLQPGETRSLAFGTEGGKQLDFAFSPSNAVVGNKVNDATIVFTNRG